MNCQGTFYAEEQLALIGIIFIAVLVFQILIRATGNLYLFVFARIRPPNLNQYGSWAVVTGATDGIGKSYACELARRGINIILISRNMDKLLSMSRKLERDYGVQVDIIQVDFSEGWKLYRYIQEKLNEKDIGILVNNVGTIGEEPERFICMKERSLVKTVSVNVNSVLIMTSIILPQMLQKNKGAVVNVSSITSQFIIPFTACYGATKAVVNLLSQSLHYEYKSTSVVFQNLIPAFIKTKLLPFTDLWTLFGHLVPDAEVYCRSAVVTLGYNNVTTGYWLHNFFYIMKFLPQSSSKNIMVFLKKREKSNR